jgi:hypothetical protein
MQSSETASYSLLASAVPPDPAVVRQLEHSRMTKYLSRLQHFEDEYHIDGTLRSVLLLAAGARQLWSQTSLLALALSLGAAGAAD